jgi:O-antigen/teichoic acid export membrane protein
MKLASLPLLTLALAAIRVLAAVFGLGVQIWLVQEFGATAFGQFSYFVTTVALLSLLAQGGMDTWVLRAVAPWQATGVAWTQLSATLVRYLRLGLVTSVGVGVVYGLVAHWLPGQNSAVSTIWFVLAGAALLVFRVLLGAARGLRMALLADGAENLVRTLSMLLLAWVGLQLDVFGSATVNSRSQGLVMAYCLSFSLAAIWLLYRLRIASTGGVGVVSTAQQYGWRAHISFTGTALLGYAFFQLDTLWLGHYLSAVELGAYNMACNLVRLVIFFPMIVVALLQPRLAAALVERQAPRVRRLVGVALLTSGVAALGCALVLALVGDWLLARIHPAYLVASVSLRWLMAVHCLNAVLMVWAACLAVSHRYVYTLWAQVPGVVVTVLLYAWAIPRWGMQAAPAAVLAGMLVCAFVYIAMVYKQGGHWHAVLLPPVE